MYLARLVRRDLADCVNGRAAAVTPCLLACRTRHPPVVHTRISTITELCGRPRPLSTAPGPAGVVARLRGMMQAVQRFTAGVKGIFADFQRSREIRRQVLFVPRACWCDVRQVQDPASRCFGRPETLSRRELLHLRQARQVTIALRVAHRRQTSADIWKTVPLLVVFALPTIGAVAAAMIGCALRCPSFT